MDREQLRWLFFSFDGRISRMAYFLAGLLLAMFQGFALYQLIQEIMRGEPPLGPGAPPAERLAAFYAAMVDLLERHLHLALGAETGSARFHTGAYDFWRLHVRTLLTGSRVDDMDAAIDVLLAPLAPELYHFQRHELGLTQERITAALSALATRILGADVT